MKENSIGYIIRNYFSANSGDIRYIICPFIQRDTIDDVLPSTQTDTIVITRWRQEDLRSGVSDPEVYKFCEENSYTLKIHPRLHAKVYSWDLDMGLIGSPNLTFAGTHDGPDTNFEVLTDPIKISLDVKENCEYL